MEVTITRVAVTKPEDAEVVAGEEGVGSSGKQTEMGRKALVPYGLYRAHGFFNPHFAEKTKFAADDLALFWQALQYMWDFDRSAARGLMSCRSLYVFSHATALGNAPAHRLFDRITCRLQEGRQVARTFGDYQITVDATDLPEGVVLSRILE